MFSGNRRHAKTEQPKREKNRGQYGLQMTVWGKYLRNSARICACNICENLKPSSQAGKKHPRSCVDDDGIQPNRNWLLKEHLLGDVNVLVSVSINSSGFLLRLQFLISSHHMGFMWLKAFVMRVQPLHKSEPHSH